MNIAIFGATGRVGSRLVSLALDAGHHVQVLVRNRSKLALKSGQLEVIEGELENDYKVVQALLGAEVVFSTMGGNLDEDPEEAAKRMTHIINGMNKHAISRILAIGGMGILQENEITMNKDKPSFSPEYLNVSNVHLKTFESLYTSNLEWTLVCPPTIVDNDLMRSYRIRKNFNPQDGFEIGTTDLANFMLKEAIENKFLKSRVGIAY